jgi:hypothetical protein
MELKYNINKIHSDLLSNFEEVRIDEKSDKKFGNYFLISAINEGKEVKLILTKKSVESGNLNWSYYSNPLKEDSLLVERTSSIVDITTDVKDVITKNRFDEEYITSINNK